MESPILPKDYALEAINSNSIKKHRKKLAASSKSSKKCPKFHSNKNNLIQIHHFDKLEKIPKNNECQSHKLKILDPNYKKDKCLERIILSDIIENGDNSNNKEVIDNKDKFTFQTQKQINKYFIVISNYDDEVKSKKSRKKRSVNLSKTYKD